MPIGGRIFADIDSARGLETQLKIHLQGIKNNYDDITLVVESLDEGWTGEVKDEYTEYFEDSKESFERLFALLDEYINYLGKCLDTFEQVDKDISDQYKTFD